MNARRLRLKGGKDGGATAPGEASDAPSRAIPGHDLIRRLRPFASRPMPHWAEITPPAALQPRPSRGPLNKLQRNRRAGLGLCKALSV
ncbi:MAG: hypothetical protein WA705_01995 [Candidatus Ozemobacteraceae bacterium]